MGKIALLIIFCADDADFRDFSSDINFETFEQCALQSRVATKCFKFQSVFRFVFASFCTPDCVILYTK